MPKKTDNHEYEVPQRGEKDWDKPLNENIRKFDRDVEIRDEKSNRGNYEPVDGAKFFATDTGDVYLGDGNAWRELTTTGALPGFGGKGDVGVEVEFEGTIPEATALSAINLGKGPGIYAGSTNDVALVADGRNGPAALHAAGTIRAGPDGTTGTLSLDGDNGEIETVGDISVLGIGGDTVLNVSGQTGTLQFGSSSDAMASKPMMRIYEGGENNPTRPVVVHSEKWSGYGLFYDDSEDQFVFRGGSDDMVSIDLNAGDPSLKVAGDFEATGTKNFVQSVDTDEGEKEVVYTASEAGTPHTEASGVAQLDDGRAVVDLPDHFGWVTDPDEPIVVQMTPYSADSGGLAAVERSTRRIVVADRDGEGDYEFAYTVKGTREGHADADVVREPAEPTNEEVTQDDAEEN